MNNGKVISIFITPTGGAALQPVTSAKAVPGQGLEGDRYFKRTGTFVKPGKPMSEGMEATLIESEALDGLAREYQIALDPASSRRNILTRGIALNHLVGQTFSVGSVRMKGIKLCEPCGHLESLTQKGVKNGLIHRGGLRAQILTAGEIHIGDSISAAITP